MILKYGLLRRQRSTIPPLLRAGSLAALVIFIAPAVTLPVAAAEGLSSTQTAAVLSPGRAFSEQTGESLYKNICQGCHMADGKGATGAGRFPSLANDPNLATGRYLVAVVVKGSRGMPPFGTRMSNDQVAAVVNYVRTHFGNSYPDTIVSDEVEDVRR
jgi:mono/diheme cytochrome c family protein